MNLLERIEEGLGERKQEAADSIAIDEVSPSMFLRSSSCFDTGEINGANGVIELSKQDSTEKNEESKGTSEDKPSLRANSTMVKQPG